MKHFMIAGLLAAIGTVFCVGTAQAGSRYCSYYPEDPNCYDQVYGQKNYGQPQDFYGNEDDDEDFYGDVRRDEEMDLERPRYVARPVNACAEAGRKLRRHGYRRVRAVDCGGSNFKYIAYRGYDRYLVKVKARTGRIIYEVLN